MTTNVSCFGAADGRFCTGSTFSLPPSSYPGFILITNSQGDPIANMGSPNVTPPGAVIVSNPPEMPGGISFDRGGNYCWHDLPAGKYTVTVKDSATCSITKEFEITQPESLTVDYEILPLNCNATGLELHAIAEGGTPGYTYTLENTGISYGPISKTSGIFKNVPISEFDYRLTVVDDHACTTFLDFFVENTNNLDLSVGLKHVSCYDACDGAINAVVEGGTPPYRFILNSNPVGEYTATSGCDDETCPTAFAFTNLCAGTYTLKVLDSLGCSFTYPSDLTLTQPTAIVFATPVAENENCESDCYGSITIDTITGGTGPYTVEVTLSPEGQVVPSTLFTDGSTPTVLNNLKSGNYQVTITDSNGCSRSFNIGINPCSTINLII